MPEEKPCPLCKTNCAIERLDGDTISVRCPACGNYIAPFRIEFAFVNSENSYLISGITRNYYEINKAPFKITYQMISDGNSEDFQTKIISQEPKTVLGKAELFLQYIAHRSDYPGYMVEILLSRDYPICFCRNADELWFYINHLKEIGVIEGEFFAKDPSSLSLTAEGWQKIESMTKPNIESNQAFVAMWFDPTMDEAFEKGILPLGDKNETGFKMVLINQKHFNDKICDHILAEIKQSRFVIADCTGLRHAVLFEAGYAMGLGLPVIFTCKEGTDIKKCFDTDHYNHIVWKDAEDLKNKLKDRILATIGKVH